MKVRLLILLAFSLMLFSVVASADTVPDPNGVVSDPTCSQHDQDNNLCPNPIYTLTFSFQASNHGGGIFDFTNLSGTGWSSLTFIVAGIFSVNCQSDAFKYCGYTNGPDSTTFEFATSLDPSKPWLVEQLYPPPGANNGGITFRNEFEINLNGTLVSELGQSGDTGGWLDGNGNPVSFHVGANGATVPEPASIFLVSIGLGAMITRRRRK